MFRGFYIIVSIRFSYCLITLFTCTVIIASRFTAKYPRGYFILEYKELNKFI